MDDHPCRVADSRSRSKSCWFMRTESTLGLVTMYLEMNRTISAGVIF